MRLISRHARSVWPRFAAVAAGGFLTAALCGCTCTLQEPAGDSRQAGGAVAADAPVPGPSVVITEPQVVDGVPGDDEASYAGEPGEGDAAELGAAVQDAPEEPAADSGSPDNAADPTVPMRGVSLTETETGVTIATTCYSVEIPHGLLPDGWTYSYQDGAQLAYGWDDGAMRGYELTVKDPTGYTLFFVHAFRGYPEGATGMQGSFASRSVGDSAVGYGWQVAVSKGVHYGTDKAEQEIADWERYCQLVLPGAVL